MTRNDEIIKRIIERRAVLGWSQNKLANMSGVAPSQISRYESGKSKPSVQVLARLADAMSVPFDWLQNGSDDTAFQNEKLEDGSISMHLDLDDAKVEYIKKESEKLGVSFDDLFNKILEVGLSMYQIDYFKKNNK